MAQPATDISTGKPGIIPNQDIVLAVCVVSILAVLVIPIPTWTLDILLSINISISIVILLSTIYLRNPIDFAVNNVDLRNVCHTLKWFIIGEPHHQWTESHISALKYAKDEQVIDQHNVCGILYRWTRHIAAQAAAFLVAI